MSLAAFKARLKCKYNIQNLLHVLNRNEDKIPLQTDIPLKHVKAEVQIYGGISKIQLEHTYKNTSTDTLET